jgi:methyl-accepting chemotaxis protein
MNLLNIFKNIASANNSKMQLLRNSQALDASSTSFMMADVDLNIIYANHAVKTLLKSVEQDIKAVLPQFSADNLIGQNIDVFHKNPAHQRGMLANLKQTHTASITVGRLNFKLTLNPLFDEHGKNTGTVVEWLNQTELLVQAGMLDALDRSQAVIQFAPDGTIKTANKNFLDTMGYTLEELVGKHHRIFAEQAYANSNEYCEFWQQLNEGKFSTGEYKRLAKGGREVWLQASYNPIVNSAGKVTGVVKYAVDITAQSLKNADFSGQIEAIGKSQAVIEFNMDGVIQNANDNFLTVMGYTLEEVKGKHHSIFVEEIYKNSQDYKAFWQKLNAGEFYSDEFKRIAKGGREVWIQASYNPILDMNGKPFKVVKYATEVTQQKLQNADYAGQIEAISKSQAVIEFNMDGVIQDANDLFLQTVGYTLTEVKGKHHSIFVEPSYRSSHEYREFWQQLNAGVYSVNEFKRIDKMGNEVWLQASYNPILDLNGKPFKVVKYATNISGRKQAINEIKEVLITLSEGDLTTSITSEFEGEFKELGDAINTFIRDLTDTISQINVATGTISGAATEIAQGNADLSSRTEQQASSLEETASAMEELTGTVRLNAENANQANSLASEASGVAIEGGSIIQKVVETMSSINESARKIADIIGVIDGIAFQTNILALNAAVEAARAGEQGRGFAVVASEVRSLAQRSANAAKDIKELISDSVKKIENGNTLVNQSGDTMDKVVTSIKRVNDIMSEIAAASAEQATGIDEVSKAVAQMDEVTQQNAALVEEAAAAAESLQAEAEQLATRVAMFKLDDSQDKQPVLSKKRLTNKLTPNDKPTAKAPKIPVAKKLKATAVTADEDEWESF